MKSLKFTMMLLVVGALAGSAQTPVDVAVFGSWIDVQGENTFEDEFGLTTDFDSGDGFGVAVNWFWTDRLSTELSASALRTRAGLALDGERVVDLGSMDLTPISLTLQFHLAPRSALDPYLGVGAAWVLADDLESQDLRELGLDRIEIDDELTYVLNAGVGVRLTRSFGLYLDGKYFALEPATRAPGEEEVDLEINPLVVSAGVRLRF